MSAFMIFPLKSPRERRKEGPESPWSPESEAWGHRSTAPGQETEFGYVASGRVQYLRFPGTVAECVSVCTQGEEGGAGVL